MTETAEFWKKHNYELVITEDQSPSLRWLGFETQETMHHRGGAYSETQLIYGEPLRASLDSSGRSALSVGLGLGYNEILVATEALRCQIEPQDFRLLSYESDPFLREHFQAWIHSQQSDLIYDQILSFFKADAVGVKDWLREALARQTWKIEDALTENFVLSETYEVLFYDAFSSKTSPYLWQEDFLKSFFGKACAPKSYVSTYACTGALKRALKSQGFEIHLRPGFQGKRNSTLGMRSTFSVP